MKTYEDHKEYKRNHQINRTKFLKIKAFEKLGNKCKHCGFSDIRALQIDHINGGGTKDKNTTTQIYKRIIEGEEGFQILCANCNWIKRHENNELPGRPRISMQDLKDDMNKYIDIGSTIKKTPVVFL